MKPIIKIDVSDEVIARLEAAMAETNLESPAPIMNWQREDLDMKRKAAIERVADEYGIELVEPDPFCRAWTSLDEGDGYTIERSRYCAHHMAIDNSLWHVVVWRARGFNRTRGKWWDAIEKVQLVPFREWDTLVIGPPYDELTPM